MARQSTSRSRKGGSTMGRKSSAKSGKSTGQQKSRRGATLSGARSGGSQRKQSDKLGWSGLEDVGGVEDRGI